MGTLDVRRDISRSLYLYNNYEYVKKWADLHWGKACDSFSVKAEMERVMKSWEVYWQDAMDKFAEGDRRFFPGDSDDLGLHWPGREGDMVSFYLPEAQKHRKTLRDNIYPDHQKEMETLVYLAMAHANLHISTVGLERGASANDEDQFEVPIPA